MIPTTDPGKALRDNQPLLAYWQKQTGRTPELTIPTSYAAVVEALANDKVDIAYLGGFTYVQASARAGVKPLVQRSIDQQFHSVFITPADSKIHSLADLHGHFVFGDVNSTSGHLMPLYYMQQEKVDPEVIKNASYSGGHDATALAVANGKAEAGAMDEQVYKKMIGKRPIEARSGPGVLHHAPLLRLRLGSEQESRPEDRERLCGFHEGVEPGSARPEGTARPSEREGLRGRE